MQRFPRLRTTTGFTLVELAVVLVVIGLLVGGIVAGQSMIRGAAIKSVTADFNKYSFAINAFKKQYGGLPGDLIDATDYWGLDPNGCGADIVQTPRSATCNGDGNGQIAMFDWGDPTTLYELYRVWQHLSDAGLIKGTYSGVALDTWNPILMAPGVSSPGSQLTSAAGWRIRALISNTTTGDFGGDGSYWPSHYGNTLEILKSDGQTGVLTPNEASSIDSKIDDGLPGYGTVMTNYINGCVDSANQTTANYNLSNTGNVCMLTFKLGL